MHVRRLIAIGVCALCAGLVQDPWRRTEAAPDRRFERLLDVVVAGEPALQRRFAEVALRALIAANRAELSGRPGEPRADAWRGGAAQFVARLERAYARLDGYHDVIVIRERRGVVRLALDDEQVMLSAPRLSAQDALDARIAAEMCREIECAAPPPTASVDEYARQVRQEWIFGDNVTPRLSASDGLNCVFQDTRHLRLKERTCAGLMHDLRSVAEGLRAVAEHGGVLEWDALRLAAGGESPAQIIYARDGTFFNLEFRYLQQSPELLREAIPWLQARLRGYAGYYMIEVPERLIYLQAR